MVRGGSALAAGSDGCVFDGTFASDGTWTKTTDTVTKVYKPSLQTIAADEYAAMVLVREATGGEGVVVASKEPVSIAKIDADSPAWEDSNQAAVSQKTCSEVKGGTNLTGIELPRIVGTLGSLRPTLPTESFDLIEKAVEQMAKAKIVHMDFAARNIFYKEGPVLVLGDFGNTFQIREDDNYVDFDSRIKAFVAKYNFGKRFDAVSSIDGITPMAVALIVVYNALIQPTDELYNYVIGTLRSTYSKRTMELASLAWISKILSIGQHDAATKAALNDFMSGLQEFLMKIIGIFTPEDRTYEVIREKFLGGVRKALIRQLEQSDTRLLAFLKLRYTQSPLTADGVRKLQEVMFGKKQGGGRRRGGGEEDLLYPSLEDALATKLPELSPDSMKIPNIPIEDALDQLGGTTRLKMKTRRKRVKMSRRK
jgi:hypothetical protein